jgi:hypothetical protein
MNLSYYQYFSTGYYWIFRVRIIYKCNAAFSCPNWQSCHFVELAGSYLISPKLKNLHEAGF